MLGALSRFGSSKGMVAMPNLSGLTREQARAAIQSAGLRFNAESSSSTTNQSLNDRINSQSVNAGTLIDYELPISFVYSSYVPPAIVLVDVISGPCYSVGSSSSTFCSGTTLLTTTTTFRENQVTYSYSDGSVSVQTQSCSSVSSTSSISNSTTCGYVPPAPTCSANCGSYTWGPCSGGVQIGERVCTRTDCSIRFEETTRSCCSSGCGSYSWGGCSGGTQSGTRTCTRSDCSKYTQSDSRCCSMTVEGSWSRCSGGVQDRVVTTFSSSCDSTSRLQSRGCTTPTTGRLVAV